MTWKEINSNWNSGDIPAIRSQSISQFRCYFCGKSDLKLSFTDVNTDTERVEVYCDNPHCDARTICVLVHNVISDSNVYFRRDNQALLAVDHPVDCTNNNGTLNFQSWDMYNSPVDILSRRRTYGEVSVSSKHSKRALMDLAKMGAKFIRKQDRG